MFEQVNTQQFVSFSKQMTDTALKAQGLAIAGFERALGLQMKALESRVQANIDFMSQAAEMRDINAMKDLFPKSVSFARDNAEAMYSTSQELVGISVKTTEAIGELVRGTFEAANDTLKPSVAKKAAK